MKEAFQLFFKGLAMGAANVIPGVSGGTIALITGIFERLINAIKAINFKAVQLFFTGQFKAFAKQIDFWFLVFVFTGVGVAIVSLARLFDFLFLNYPVYIWSYFFGLLLASVYFVGRTVKKWDVSVWISFVIGGAIALSITFLTPAVENRNFMYLIACGVVAVCSMILPGLSGSFVLILMGNYQLVAIEAINNLDFTILFPVLIGMAVGLIAFSHLLSWLLKKFNNQTIAMLTGFIFGSLGIIWPWKKIIYFTDTLGEIIMKGDKAVVKHYEAILPDSLGQTELIAIFIMLVGILTIWLIEKTAKSNH